MSQRPTLRVGLHFWRRLSATPRYGGARPAHRRYRCDVHAPGRNRPPYRAGGACCACHRWRRLSRRGATRRPAQHHARPPAALRSRAEPGRKCLGIPPYAPELNPVENVWEYLRGNKLAITVFENYDDIVDKSCAAWRFFADDPERVASITSRTWATVIP